uniref:hypothetical protein n=1 Tax=Sphingomonas elodea TaxID=179878 RepID=UPI001ED984BD
NIMAALPSVIGNTIGNLVADRVGSLARRAQDPLAGTGVCVLAAGGPPTAMALQSEIAVVSGGKPPESVDEARQMQDAAIKKVYASHASREAKADAERQVRAAFSGYLDEGYYIKPADQVRTDIIQGTGEFIGGLATGLFDVGADLARGLYHTVTTNPVTTLRDLEFGIAGAVDGALEAENTPARLQISAAVDELSKASAYDYGHGISTIVGNVALLLAPEAVVAKFSSVARLGSGADAAIAAESVSARHIAWSSDLGAITDTVAALGQRALRNSGGNWSQSEALFDRYLALADARLARAGSGYAVELQPAAIAGGERVPSFIWMHRGDATSPLIMGADGAPRLFAYPGSRRLDAGIIDMNAAPNQYGLRPVVSGYDITLNAAKPPIGGYYREHFGNIPINDIRLRSGN